MDNFKEQIVKKNFSQKDTLSAWMMRIAGFALGLAIVFATMAFATNFAVIGIFVACLCVYGGFMLAGRLEVEYEYIFTNGEMDVDKIIAQRARKRLCTVRFGSATDFGVCDSNFTVANGRTLVLASSNADDEVEYYVDFNHKSLGETTLVFTPNEEMLELIRPTLPRTLRK